MSLVASNGASFAATVVAGLVVFGAAELFAICLYLIAKKK